MTTGRINQVTTLGRNIQRLSYGLLVFLFGFLTNVEWITLRPPLAPAKRCSESRVQAESRLANWECSRTRSFFPFPSEEEEDEEGERLSARIRPLSQTHDCASRNRTDFSSFAAFIKTALCLFPPKHGRSAAESGQARSSPIQHVFGSGHFLSVADRKSVV